MEYAVAQFAQQAERHGRWMVFWAAGSAVVGSSEPALQAEVATWGLFLDLLAKHGLGDGSLARRAPGTIFLASSAGAVFGNNPEQPLTEASAPSPISLYGRTRLVQEEILREYARGQQAIAYLIGRISNLYGPGQNLAKAQGLLSHLSRCLIYNKPLHLYVPLDTIRDYVSVDACADHIVNCVLYLTDQNGPDREASGYVKVMASEQETSLAQIIATFARVSHRCPKLICCPSPKGALQPSRLQFRSLLWRHLGTPGGLSLQAGIKRLHQHHLALYLQGRLPPPS
jgi:UDP-glucose 4-epimerase